MQTSPFIFSLDADAIADWDRRFGPDGSQMLEVVLSNILTSPQLEFFHFTPSPSYCPAEEAIKIWDKTRGIVTNLK